MSLKYGVGRTLRVNYATGAFSKNSGLVQEWIPFISPPFLKQNGVFCSKNKALGNVNSEEQTLSWDKYAHEQISH